MVQDPIPHLPAEVQASPIPLQDIHQAKALLIVLKPQGTDPVQGALTGMAERRVPQIMPQRDRLSQILIESEGLCDRSGVLRDLKRVGHPGPVVIAERSQKDLGLLLEPTEGLAVQDPVPVPLKSRPDVARCLLARTSPALGRETRPGCQDLLLSSLQFLADRHEFLHRNSRAHRCCIRLCRKNRQPAAEFKILPQVLRAGNMAATSCSAYPAGTGKGFPVSILP